MESKWLSRFSNSTNASKCEECPDGKYSQKSINIIFNKNLSYYESKFGIMFSELWYIEGNYLKAPNNTDSILQFTVNVVQKNSYIYLNYQATGNEACPSISINHEEQSMRHY